MCWMLFFYLIFTHFLSDESHSRWEIWDEKLSYLIFSKVKYSSDTRKQTYLTHSMAYIFYA